jgi:glycosyltransferase involved in cell wall biosynthesis
LTKVVHVPFCFYPDPVGGTEIYVGSLARQLQILGIEAIIAAPTSAGLETYEHEGLRVSRFPVSRESSRMLTELYGAGDPHAPSHFGRILDQEKPDVVHLHAFTRGVSLLLAQEVKRRGIKLVFTYHTPTVSCQRGTLLRYGSEVCDGLLDRRLCTRCTLQGLGLNGLRGKMLSAIPPRVGKLLETAHLEGSMWTALRMSQLIELRHAAFRELMQQSDAVIALCGWVKDLLLINRVAPEKITLSRHGLPHDVDHSTTNNLSINERPLRIAFLGRLDPSKGPDILVQAVRSQPDLDVKLDIYGITQGSEGDVFFAELKRLAENDSRISFFPALPGERVVAALRNYHLLAAPSRGLETGPLVVLEAFAAGIPVIGSNLGGITELVADGINGVLVNDDSPQTWAKQLEHLAHDRRRFSALTNAVQQPRSMRDVAVEMLTLYRRLAPQSSVPAAVATLETYA